MKLSFNSNWGKKEDATTGILLALAFASVPAWADKGLLFFCSVLLTHILFALSFNLIFGLSGFVSFGHAAFFAIGAYTTGYLLQRQGEMYPFLFWIASGLSGAVAAIIVAAIALRRSSGVYFAILTLALAELVHVLISKSTFLGREDGMTGIKRPVMGSGILQVDLAAGDNLYYAILIGAIFVGVVIYMLWHNAFGRTLGAIRQDEERVRFLGVNVLAMRIGVFVASGAFAGLAGGLYAPSAQLLTPDLGNWGYSALPILFCLVGGANYFWGPVLGAIIFAGLEYATRDVIGLSEIIVGMVLLIVVLAFPGGLIGGVITFRQRWPGRLSRNASSASLVRESAE